MQPKLWKLTSLVCSDEDRRVCSIVLGSLPALKIMVEDLLGRPLNWQLRPEGWWEVPHSDDPPCPIALDPATLEDVTAVLNGEGYEAEPKKLRKRLGLD